MQVFRLGGHAVGGNHIAHIASDTESRNDVRQQNRVLEHSHLLADARARRRRERHPAKRVALLEHRLVEPTVWIEFEWLIIQLLAEADSHYVGEHRRAFRNRLTKQRHAILDDEPLERHEWRGACARLRASSHCAA